MIYFLVKRLIATVPVVAFLAISVFLLIRIVPGDPAVMIAGDQATPAALEEIRNRLGLDQPLLTQMGIWFANVASGDFGQSIITKTPVLELISSRLEPTLSLSLTTIICAILIAVPLGTLAAAMRGTWVDKSVVALSVVGFSVPVFVLAYLLVLLFSIELRWLPVQGFRSIARGIGDFAAHIALPTAALTLLYMALISRMTRASVLEVLGEDHVRTARAKGLSELAVVVKHGLRNAAVPILTVVGVSFASLLTGVVVTESVFNLPGVGRLMIDAVLARDYPVIQAVVLLASLIYVTINLLVDLAYALIDPRIRY